jgi:hypothetical protein
MTVAAQRDSRLDLAANLTRAAGGPVRTDCHLTKCTPAVMLGPAGWPRSARCPRDRRSRAPLAIRRHGDGPADSAHWQARTSVTAPDPQTVRRWRRSTRNRASPDPPHCTPAETTVAIRSGDPARQRAARQTAHGQWLVSNARRRPEKKAVRYIGGQLRSGDQRHGDGLSDSTALTAIHPQPCQSGPTQLHARRDDSGDTGRRSGTPTSSPADAPRPTAEYWLGACGVTGTSRTGQGRWRRGGIRPGRA